VQNAGTLGEAVQSLKDNGCIQPMLFTFQGRHWIKVDNSAVAVNVSCTADAFELLFKYFFALNVAYPYDLYLVYGFFERMMRVKSSVGKSVRLTEFCKHVIDN